MAKTAIMVMSLAGVFLLGTACAKLFTRTSEPAAQSGVEACAGLSGQAKVDCEQHQGH